MTRYTYDPRSNLKTKIDSGGITTNYSYAASTGDPRALSLGPKGLQGMHSAGT
ncbi:MAG: hypothetical protein ACR2JB_12605 [Bryobacteraceae bacterium]